MRSGNLHVLGQLNANCYSASTDYSMTQYEYENNFLLHCDLADGIKDMAGKHKEFGSYILERNTANKKFGTHSFYVNGTSGNFYPYTKGNECNIVNSASDTVELDLWFKQYDDATKDHYLWSVRVDDNNYAGLHWDNTGGAIRIYFNVIVGGNEVFIIEKADTGLAQDDSSFHHVMIYKNATVYALYLDGTQIAYGTYAGNIAYSSVAFGRLHNKSYWAKGYFDEIRVYRGNYFGLAPVVGLTDTYTVPTAAYDNTINIEYYTASSNYILPTITINGNTDRLYNVLVYNAVETYGSVLLKIDSGSNMSSGAHFGYGSSMISYGGTSASNIFGATGNGYGALVDLTIFPQSGCFVAGISHSLAVAEGTTTIYGLSLIMRSGTTNSNNLTTFVFETTVAKTNTRLLINNYRERV